MKFEDIVSRLGDFGIYQRLLYIIPCYASVCAAIHGILSLYTLNVPSHRCRIPTLGDADSWETNASTVALHVPVRACAEKAGTIGVCFDPCHVYALNGTGGAANGTEPCPAGWVYDTSEFVSTFAMENNFVCTRDKQFLLTSVAQSYFYGLLVGSLITGFISDRFGRRLTLLTYLVLQGLTGLASGLVSGVVEFWILRFVCGAVTSGIFPAAFVIGIEFVGPSMRLHAGFIIEYVYTIGLLLAALFALWFRHWRWLTVASSCISLVSIVAAFFLPESPRWLLAVGRYHEAELIIRRAAKFNGVQLPDDLELEKHAVSATQNDSTKRESCLEVFKYRRLVALFANVVFQWLVVSFVYQGLSLGSSSLPGSIFLTSSLNAIFEAGGYLMAHLMLLWLGRKRPHVFSMIFCGLVLIASIFPTVYGQDSDLSGLFLGLALLGKLGISGAFGIIYLWTAEQIPTSMRQIVLGVAALASRLGYVIGPLIVDLNNFVQTSLGNTLPLILYGLSALIAGLTASLMPDTTGRSLPETLSEGDELVKQQRLSCCPRLDSNSAVAPAEHKAAQLPHKADNAPSVTL